MQLESAETVLLSAASIWEIEIKRARGRLAAPPDLAERALAANFAPLPIGVEHALAAGRLPLHHRDPFDRMLLAQAQVEALTLATADQTLRAYGVPLLVIARPAAASDASSR